MKNKKNNNFLFKTKRQWAKYRWEFMRRDPDFIPRFDNLLNLNNLYNEGKISEEEFEKAVRDFCKEFEIPMPLCLIDRNKSYGEIEEEKGHDSLSLYILSRNMGHAISMLSTYGGEPLPNDHLVLDIDLSKINSITALKELVIWHIDMYWKDIYLPKHPYHPKPKRMVDFDKIIQVGDLKKKEKRISWNKLGEKCFPNDMDSDSRKARAIQYYARYEELINGGWRDFNFP